MFPLDSIVRGYGLKFTIEDGKIYIEYGRKTVMFDVENLPENFEKLLKYYACAGVICETLEKLSDDLASVSTKVVNTGILVTFSSLTLRDDKDLILISSSLKKFIHNGIKYSFDVSDTIINIIAEDFKIYRDYVRIHKAIIANFEVNDLLVGESTRFNLLNGQFIDVGIEHIYFENRRIRCNQDIDTIVNFIFRRYRFDPLTRRCL